VLVGCNKGNRTREMTNQLVRCHTHTQKQNPGAPCGCNVALVAACQEHHVEVVKLLLRDPRLDPSGDDNRAMRAASNASDEITCTFLADERVDPSAELAKIVLVNCSRNGFEGAVAMHLKGDGVDVDGLRRALWYACKVDHPGVVKILLDDGRADPGLMLAHACSNESWETVPVLRGDPRVDPNAYSTVRSIRPALVLAVIHDHAETVAALLGDSRTQPMIEDNAALKAARSDQVRARRWILFV
jgi:proteasome lid subunit RPN8/RPN11